MHRPPLTEEARFVRERPSVSPRVGFRTHPTNPFTEQTGRLDALWATGCAIQTLLHLDASAEVRQKTDHPTNRTLCAITLQPTESDVSQGHPLIWATRG